MKLIEIRCPNCGGDLKVNPEKEKLVCGYCHTEFLVDDEVKRLETHHTYTDEAKVKRVELEKEIELKKLQMEEKRREESKKVTTIMAVITIIGVLISIITWNSESMIPLLMMAVIPWMWIGRAIANESKKENNKDDDE